jgi:hypothetical protein
MVEMGEEARRPTSGVLVESARREIAIMGIVRWGCRHRGETSLSTQRSSD